MDMARMMELISLQRHDFLNHFQIISGLLQLNRNEQAREYITATARQITGLSRIVHLKIPEAAASVMLVHYEAAERGVTVEYDVQANLEGCTVPAVKLGAALETVLLYAVECLTPWENQERTMRVRITAGDGGYLFGVRFKQPPAKKGRYAGGILREMDDVLSMYGGSITAPPGASEADGEIRVFLPATRPKE